MRVSRGTQVAGRKASPAFSAGRSRAGAKARKSAEIKARSSIHGAQGRNRTTDTVIFSHVLYQLSYLGAVPTATTDTKRRGYKDKNKDCPVRPRSAAEEGIAAKRR